MRRSVTFIFQGLVGAIFEGVGVSTGSFIGGIMFERVGGSSTFRIYGISVLVFCVIHVVLQKLIQRYSNVNGKDRFESNTVQASNEDVNDAIAKSDLLFVEKDNVGGKGI